MRDADTVSVFVPGELVERLRDPTRLDERMQRELMEKAQAQGWPGGTPVDFGYLLEYGRGDPRPVIGIRYFVTRALGRRA
jgi:hypothetical protein